jgi:hypothetical protein
MHDVYNMMQLQMVTSNQNRSIIIMITNKNKLFELTCLVLSTGNIIAIVAPLTQ